MASDSMEFSCNVDIRELPDEALAGKLPVCLGGTGIKGCLRDAEACLKAGSDRHPSTLVNLIETQRRARAVERQVSLPAPPTPMSQLEQDYLKGLWGQPSNG